METVGVLLILSSSLAVVKCVKAEAKEETCVAGHCLPLDYNRLELPSNVTYVDMNLEVSP